MALEADFYDYRDAELSLRVPSYLRQKKGMPFFGAQSKKDKRHPLLHFAVELLQSDAVRVHREIMMFTDPRANEERMGVRGELLRRGKPSYLDDGLEVLNAIHIAVTGDTFYGYAVLFQLGLCHVYTTFFGQGELTAFEESCRQIVSSVQLAEAGEAQPPAPTRTYAVGGLGRADTKRLKQSLNGLPVELAYLRKAIMAVAQEDQDLLGSGNVDIEPIVQSLRKVAEPAAVERTAAAHAEALHR